MRSHGKPLRDREVSRTSNAPRTFEVMEENRWMCRSALRFSPCRGASSFGASRYPSGCNRDPHSPEPKADKRLSTPEPRYFREDARGWGLLQERYPHISPAASSAHMRAVSSTTAEPD